MNDLGMNRQGHFRQVITEPGIDRKPGKVLRASGLQKGTCGPSLFMISDCQSLKQSWHKC
jgi:hypothetical protein